MSVATCNTAHNLISLMSWTSGLHSNTLTEPRTFDRKHFLDNIHFGYTQKKKKKLKWNLKKWDLGVCRPLPTTTKYQLDLREKCQRYNSSFIQVMTINSILIHTPTMSIFQFQPLLHNALCGHAKVLLLYMPFEFVPQSACKNSDMHHMLTTTKKQRQNESILQL